MARRSAPGRARTSSPRSSSSLLSRAHESVLPEQSQYVQDMLREQRVRTVQAVYPRVLPARTAFPFRSSRRPLSFLFTKPRAARLPSGRQSRDMLRLLRLDPRTMVCVRRGQRREVLFAYRVAGRRGVGAGKRWRRSVHSQWSC